jgi:hypothetical protein
MTDFDSIRQNFPLVDVAARYCDMRKKASEYVALCIFHADSTAPGNLTFYRGRDGLWRFRCWACSAQGDVVDFVAQAEGCSVAEAGKRIAGNALPEIGRYTPPPAPDKAEVESWTPIVPAPVDAPAYDPAKTWNPRRGKFVRYAPTRTDTYRSSDGRVLCHVVRLEFEDGQKLCPTITWCRGPDGAERWAAKRMPAPYPLQGLDALAAKPGAAVLICEGEKTREAAARELPMFAVVTVLGGCEAVKHADITPLLGRSLIYAPDADAPGVRAMMELHKRVASAHNG